MQLQNQLGKSFACLVFIVRGVDNYVTPPILFVAKSVDCKVCCSWSKLYLIAEVQTLHAPELTRFSHILF